MALAAHADAEGRALALWERAVGLDRWRRDDALLASTGAVPDGLGARNAALLAVRNAVFDPAWPLRSRCPDCAAEVEFAVDSLALARELADMKPPDSPAAVHWRERPVELRAPTVQDLRGVSAHADRRAAARALLARCAAGPHAEQADGADPMELDDRAIDELGRRIEALDPAAVVGFALSCPECGHGWSAAVDIAEALWSELRLAAERTLTDVDALARAYGWAEHEVLHLSPARRAAYLQLVDLA